MEIGKKAYFIFDVNVAKPEGMRPYHEKVAETFKAFGGQLLVLGGTQECFEGKNPNGVLIVLQFDSMEKARAWYNSPSYQEILPHRLASAEANAWLAEAV